MLMDRSGEKGECKKQWVFNMKICPEGRAQSQQSKYYNRMQIVLQAHRWPAVLGSEGCYPKPEITLSPQIFQEWE